MTWVQIPLSLILMLNFILALTPYKIIFFTISLGLLVSSSFVITLQNSVHCVIGLVACFLFASCFLLFFESEFFAFLFLTIYVGAIAILFLFVVMMLNNKFIMLSKRDPKKYFFFGSLVGLNFLFFIYNSINIFFPYRIEDSETFLDNKGLEAMHGKGIVEVIFLNQIHLVICSLDTSVCFL